MALSKILMSNIGYARGINGCLSHHIFYAHRHLYCPPDVQEQALAQLSELIEQEDPDICCFVEIEQGSPASANFNQLERLIGEKYMFYDIENKYGQMSRLRSWPLTRGKSNAFMAKRQLPYEKLYFRHGAKRLIYKIRLDAHTTLFFAHFSLKKAVRALQLEQVRELLKSTPGEIIFLGDFNVLTGLQEIAPLLHEDHFMLLNRADDPTFTFHRMKLVLDLCICSKQIARHINLRVVPQPYSDHAALLLELHKGGER
jgi:endonuclease/exonuclease/phosphatase family metal-dependent hydrolase